MSIMAAELGVHIVLLCLVVLHSKNNFNHAVWVFQLQQNDFLSIHTEFYFSHTEFYFSHAEFTSPTLDCTAPLGLNACVQYRVSAM